MISHWKNLAYFLLYSPFLFFVILQTKWCPAPGCDYAVDFIVGSGSYDVTCRCSYSFCWNVSISELVKICVFSYGSCTVFLWYVCIYACLVVLVFLLLSILISLSYWLWQCTEEAHRPVDCGTVAKWILKNSAESENMNW